MSNSSAVMEDLFARGEDEQPGGEGSPEQQRLSERLQGLVLRYEPAVLWAQRLLVWERPLHSILTACALNGVFGLLSSTSLRPLFLMSVTLLGMVLLDKWKLLPDAACGRLWKFQVRGHESSSNRLTGSVDRAGASVTRAVWTGLEPVLQAVWTGLEPVLQAVWTGLEPVLQAMWTGLKPVLQGRESAAVHPRLLSIPELCHHLAESYFTWTLYLQEMLQYKRQSPGKFCAVVCAGCSVLAVIGHYIPGIMISYIILLSVLLWPLVVYHELIQKMYTGLEPILMKLDYSMKGGTHHRKHQKKKVKSEPGGDDAVAETDSESEEELSCFSPMVFLGTMFTVTGIQLVDVKTTALALAITDSELSDEEASFLESGGFSVSRATTPQLTDVSEDQQSVTSEPEETFSTELPEFPSVEEFTWSEQGPEGGLEEMDTEQTSASFLIQRLASPLHFVNTHFNGHGQPTGGASKQEGPEGLSLTLEGLSEEIVSTAIATVVHNTLSALLRSNEASEAPSITELLPREPQECVEGRLAETELKEQPEVGLEDEDFELLDQKELEQADAALGLSTQHRPGEQGPPTAQASHTASPKPSPKHSQS
ncbi:Protein FAM134A [Acipenser ruthenus]|uniref:Protein FAM134A n=1 Tax=Acipenser ruthenus TaxID=7906 RepID=A0A444UN54_ACIRT|nr:Protein FAM134A [Acipenser ruthenus]